MNPIESILSRYPLMVLDCALGTEIAKRGFDTNDSLWSAKALYERPELIREILKSITIRAPTLSRRRAIRRRFLVLRRRGSRTMNRQT